jgi:hypothetical protein
MASAKGWLCPICRTWNRAVDVVCVNTPQHDSDSEDDD